MSEPTSFFIVARWLSAGYDIWKQESRKWEGVAPAHKIPFIRELNSFTEVPSHLQRHLIARMTSHGHVWLQRSLGKQAFPAPRVEEGKGIFAWEQVLLSQPRGFALVRKIPAELHHTACHHAMCPRKVKQQLLTLPQNQNWIVELLLPL